MKNIASVFDRTKNQVRRIYAVQYYSDLKLRNEAIWLALSFRSFKSDSSGIELYLETPANE